MYLEIPARKMDRLKGAIHMALEQVGTVSTAVGAVLADRPGIAISEDVQVFDKDKVAEVELDRLHGFKDHPFKIYGGEEMEQLKSSILEIGVITPIIVRPDESSKSGHPGRDADKDDPGTGEGGSANGGADLEIISGHCRVSACRQLGMKTIPALIVDLDDDEAVITMVDSNQQRKNPSISELARSLRMRSDAMRHQGKRNDLGRTSHTARLLESTAGIDSGVSPTGDVHRIYEAGSMEQDGAFRRLKRPGDQDGPSTGMPGNRDTRAVLSERSGMAPSRVRQYIRLSYLDEGLLDLVDRKRIKISPGVELSYIPSQYQGSVLKVIKKTQAYPKMKQATALRERLQDGTLGKRKAERLIEEILCEGEGGKADGAARRSGDRGSGIRWRETRFSELFPDDYSDLQIEEELIESQKGWSAIRDLFPKGASTEFITETLLELVENGLKKEFGIGGVQEEE